MRDHNDLELKVAFSMCYGEHGKYLANYLMSDNDPKEEAARSAARRREGYTDEELNNKTITLRRHFEEIDKYELALAKLTASAKKEYLDLFDSGLTRGEVEGERDRATSSQSGTDRALTNAQKRIAALEAQVAKLTQERDAARLAYLGLLDQQAKQ